MYDECQVLYAGSLRQPSMVSSGIGHTIGFQAQEPWLKVDSLGNVTTVQVGRLKQARAMSRWNEVSISVDQDDEISELLTRVWRQSVRAGGQAAFGEGAQHTFQRPEVRVCRLCLSARGAASGAGLPRMFLIMRPISKGLSA